MKSGGEEDAAPPHQGRNISLLVLSYALNFSVVAGNLATSSRAAFAVYPNESAATLPNFTCFLVHCLASFPLAHLTRTRGYRLVFGVASVVGVPATAVSCLAMAVNSFLLFCLGAVFFGVAQASAQLHRFASLDPRICRPSFRPYSISLVLGGAVFGAFLGPELAQGGSRFSSTIGGEEVYDALPRGVEEEPEIGSVSNYAFATAYAALAIPYLLAFACTLLLKVKPLASQKQQLPSPLKRDDTDEKNEAGCVVEIEPEEVTGKEEDAEGPVVGLSNKSTATCLDDSDASTPTPASPPEGPRSLWRILKESPSVRLSVVTAAVAYSMMILVMTPTPIAMELLGFSAREVTVVIQTHIACMFIPSFATGYLIDRVLGTIGTVLAGELVFLLSLVVLIFLKGTLVGQIAGLGGVGLAWNWMFVSATTLLASSYRKEPHDETAKVQGFNEICVFGLAAIGSGGGGLLLGGIGWAGALLLCCGVLLMTTLYTLKHALPDMGKWLRRHSGEGLGGAEVACQSA
ncbi:unnamed protein product [Vitrella brassicaformis CCMP3155]|uniref:Major facilitator superfamily (MFS) profile domain-containing protein n=1 Tax=Vitrella brassicaformis (strain CCMP3155) TaxID=1169540 RepID=A0A0G4F379_VITBC|nr:unnamed protein product [Vitrella brassicaformis CCMP3155]|eukprot:CEM06369.1 unnamed protein product [Vitrella brassicaformis CCMP3155]